MAKVQKGLQRELMRNPAKSATLLALLPLAAYFILPLVWKPSLKSSTASASFLAPAAEGAVPTGNVDSGLPSWRQTALWLIQDPRMKSALEFAGRNPFTATAVPESSPSDEDELARAAELAAAKATPATLGMELTATIVGPRTRLATINGRTYSESSTIRTTRDPAAKPATRDRDFVLISVAKTHVLLARSGEVHRLTLRRPSESDQGLNDEEGWSGESSP